MRNVPDRYGVTRFGECPPRGLLARSSSFTSPKRVTPYRSCAVPQRSLKRSAGPGWGSPSRRSKGGGAGAARAGDIRRDGLPRSGPAHGKQPAAASWPHEARDLEHPGMQGPRRQGELPAHRRRRPSARGFRRALPARDFGQRSRCAAECEIAALLPCFQVFFGAAQDTFQRAALRGFDPFCVHAQKYLPAAVAFDFFFVTDGLRDRVRRVEVDGATRASDHQPVLLELDGTG